MALFSPHSLILPPSYLPIPPNFFPKSHHFSSIPPALISKSLKAPRNFPFATTTKTLLSSSSSQSFAISETEEDDFEEFDDIHFEEFDFEGLVDEEDEEDGGGGGDDELDPFGDAPWEGSVMYQRNAAATHVEYATTLERLGLEGLSSEASQQRAAAMGIRLPSPFSRRRQEEEKEEEMTTPALVSVDVTRRRGRIRLDGIVRTVLALPCYECAQPAAHPVFSNFSLLLSEDPIEEPPEEEKYDIYREHKSKVSSRVKFEEQYDEDQDIDWEDRLYFPPGEKEIDISKPIRDIVHLAIRIDVVCSPSCKGLCLSCGTNLNWSSCRCKEEAEDGDDNRRHGPFKDLLKQMKQKK